MIFDIFPTVGDYFIVVEISLNEESLYLSILRLLSWWHGAIEISVYYYYLLFTVKYSYYKHCQYNYWIAKYWITHGIG